MNEESLRRICRENGLFATPALNTKLGLQHYGFSKIEHLDAYLGLQVSCRVGVCVWAAAVVWSDSVAPAVSLPPGQRHHQD